MKKFILLKVVILALSIIIFSHLNAQDFNLDKNSTIINNIKSKYLNNIIAENKDYNTKIITLKEAIELAIKNNPRLKIAEKSLQQAIALKGEIIEFEPLDINYSWGQLNGENRKDKETSINQAFGSLLTPFYKNKLVNKTITSQSTYKELIKKEVVADVKRAWAYYIYTWNIMETYKQIDTCVKEIVNKVKSQYKNGEITILERNLVLTKISFLDNKIYMAEQETNLAIEKIRWICYSDLYITPKERNIENNIFDLSTNFTEFDVDSTLHIQYMKSLSKQKKAELDVEKSRLFPQISFGYAIQNMLPLKNLSSWNIGVKIPLLYFPTKSKIKIAKLEYEKSILEEQLTSIDNYNKLKELITAITRYK